MEDFEKLGVCYLGRVFDMKTHKTKDELVLYSSKDLVTHAVCVGMTGSGKTGLCISLIEEAALDGIPSILIDPKGDLANLLLTFPGLSGADFLPWINLDDARQKNMTPQAYADKQAETWKSGLAGWGEDGARIQRLKDAVEMLIYTPGSNAGLPVSIMKSFAAPPAAILEDEDLLRERISTTVMSLLGLVGINADPVQSREHILLSTLIDAAWRAGKDLDLAVLIQQVQTPPISKIGVLDLESFYPSRERFNLAVALNNLLASPGFNAWLQGTPLDIGQILYTPSGKPRIAIFSIAHLGDPERMFFVSLLMNQILGWMRGQSGTTSLRAIVYMDEIFGFLPPVANPPSKLPMLTLLKQARAFGVGLVLATQNPVDLDYKGLNNAGTWFIGRLQTERDKGRLLDGLDSAASTTGTQFNRKKIESILSSLTNRVFLMNNTHEDGPEIFQTRWALSYLRGPLTRDQIKSLMDPVKAAMPKNAVPTPTAASAVSNTLPTGAAVTGAAAALAPGIQSFYIPVRGSGMQGSQLVYMPKILGAARVNFSNDKVKINLQKNLVYLTDVTDNALPVVWDNATEESIPPADLEKAPRQGGSFSDLPAAANQSKNYATWNKDFSTWLYGSQSLEVLFSPSTKEVSQPGESEQAFRLRLGQTNREQRDDQLDGLKGKYAAKLALLQERLRKAEATKQKQADQARTAGLQTAVSIGSTLLGALTGRRISSSASSSIRGVGRALEENKDVARAGDTVEAIQKQIQDLNAEFNAETAAMQAASNPGSEQLQTISVRPKKTDIVVQLLTLVWAPHWQDAVGNLKPAW
jgi:hypothetical protein